MEEAGDAAPAKAPTLLVVGVRGLGRALALHFARAGFNVVAAARTGSTVEALARDAAEVQPAGSGLGTLGVIGTGGGFKLREGMAGLAAPQHALRVLVEAAGRELRAERVHCAYLAVEGQIDTPRSAAYLARNGMERTIPTREIAKAIELLHSQDPRAWTHELSLRPAAAPA